MNFKFSTEEEDFRQEVLGFLDEVLTPEFRESLEGRSYSKEFSMKMGAKGWLSLAWPKEYGGQAKNHMEQLIFNEEMARYRAPLEWHRRASQQHGFAIVLFGTEEQKKYFIPKIASSELSIANCMSEPGAGSDLANVQTRAVREGDDYIINGQKMWTSGAGYSDFGWMLVKTSATESRHKSLSLFLVDLRSPGIEIRPVPDLRAVAGDVHEFTSQIFLENVRVPGMNLIGGENRGWYVNAALMDFERSGIEAVVRNERIIDDLLEYLRALKNEAGPSDRLTILTHKLVQLKIESDISRLLSYRIAWMQSNDEIPNYQTSMAKVFKTELAKRVANVGMEILGLYGRLGPGSSRTELSDPKWDELQHAISSFFLNAPIGTIAQGTSEIHRNIMAQRGLGLPRAR
ncbi:MAG: acyl-CoA dehydrogenase family protein [Deltaproteobacteria bacterium]|nr:acyl-CoA dehydrogenase family protein [Deltaproteobacteria bacterium]